MHLAVQIVKEVKSIFVKLHNYRRHKENVKIIESLYTSD